MAIVPFGFTYGESRAFHVVAGSVVHSTQALGAIRYQLCAGLKALSWIRFASGTGLTDMTTT